MRVLCTTQPLYGHFHSVAPFALELRAQGHEVAFATARSFAPVIERLGFPVFACGVDFEATTDVTATLPESRALRSQGFPPAYAQLWAFILGLGPPMAAGLLDSASAWQPDLVLRDPLEFGGFVAAERWGIPHASVMWAIYIDPRVWIPPWIVELGTRFGLPPDSIPADYDRWLVLKTLPPAWSIAPPAQPPVTRCFGVPPFDRSSDAALPDWVAALPQRPTVYATLGTTFNQAGAHFGSVIEALAGLEVNAIVTVGHAMDPAQFGALPANVRVERYIPQSALLPSCDAVIFHGGYNTLHGALWHGLPLVAMPREAGDQRPTAEKCAELGLGVLVPAGADGQAPTPAAVREAVRAVLEQPPYRQRAQEMAAAMHALPPLNEAARQLVALAAPG